MTMKEFWREADASERLVIVWFSLMFIAVITVVAVGTWKL